MEYKDYYSILGVPRTATQAEIKKAFRKLARQYHPDTSKGKPDAERRFKEVNEANEVLADPEKRQAYDQLGANWTAYQQAAGAGMPFEEFLRQAQAGGGFGGFGRGPGGAGGSGGFAAGGFPGGIRFEYRGSPEDLEGFSDFFRAFFGGGGFDTESPARARGGRTGARGAPSARSTRSTRSGGAGPAGGGMAFDLFDFEGLGLGDLPRSGAGRAFPDGRNARAGIRPGDLEVQADLTLEEVEAGTARLVQLGEKRLEVKIPAGVADGQRIRLSGKAGAGDGGRAAGDLYVRVRVAPHARFGREGANLSCEVPVTLGEALLGDEIPVATLAGKRLLLTIPPGTQPDRVFRLRGQGLPRFRAEGRGDLLVRVRVVVPENLDARERELAETFLAAVDQPDPRSPSRPRARRGAAAHS